MLVAFLLVWSILNIITTATYELTKNVYLTNLSAYTAELRYFLTAHVLHEVFLHN